MEENRENLNNNSDKIVERDDMGRLKKGVILNPEGRPKGSKNFETDFLEVVGKIAEANNITRAEAMEILLRKAYSEAKNGQYNFYKDIMDRVYGKVVERTDLTSKGERIFNSVKDLKNEQLENIAAGSVARVSQEGTGEEKTA
ncbi:MAG: hypothetical protein UX38_C0013G0012 [Microgenomates group bacterium GW2011_GWC1_46_16]|nr:MAG: hypothetical protein UX38_C0013G0012 [Microgenomates group bacterium GW2011_GWC1_46_16]